MDQRERGGQRIALPEDDERAAEEVAALADPFPPLAAASGVLRQSNEPIALDGTLIGEKVGVGRAGALDDADSTQKIDTAARSLSDWRGSIKRYPSGDTAIADRKISTPCTG